jgi:hypothetical protein
MEMGLIVDDRSIPEEQTELLLTTEGKMLYTVLKGLIATIDFTLKDKTAKEYSWEFEEGTEYFTQQIHDFMASRAKERSIYAALMLRMDAVRQLVQFIYSDVRAAQSSKNSIYTSFFKSPAVLEYCDRNGIEPPTDTGAEHRVPFLLNVLESIGVIRTDRSNLYVEKFMLCNALLRTNADETPEMLNRRKISINNGSFSDKDVIEKLRERLGKNFYSKEYHLSKYELVIEED